MTHYSNDYFDLAADEANQTPTRWSGGSRILPDNRIDPKMALRMAIASGVVALLATLWLAFRLETGVLTLPILLISIVLAWGYSSPPLWLNSRGLGEVAGAVIITGLTPIVGFYLQAGYLSLLPFLTVFPLCCIQFAMLLVINFPDAAGDEAAGKQTLVVLMGPESAARLYHPALLLAYGSLPFLYLAGLPAVVTLAILIPVPMAIWLAWCMKNRDWTDSDRWNLLGFWSVGLMMSTTSVEFFAYIFLLWNRGTENGILTALS
jgi:1,4-dihydroxy-2-naphthoate octaprenyltransferase